MKLNPRDCISVVDVVEKLGLEKERLSFDQACRIALSSLLESARVHSVVPDPDGFDYSTKMARFQDRTAGDRLAKLEFANITRGREEFTIRPVLPESLEHRRKRTRMEELKLKIRVDDLNMSEAEHTELAELINEFNTSA